jgi:hypothetical protein
MRFPLAVAAALLALPALADPNPFFDVARVLQSPRCMNCHPSGNAPLQGDAPHAHKQNIQRAFLATGGSCSTCHLTKNLAGVGLPPGAPNWTMPPAKTPMVFQGRTPAQLCRDVKDPAKNGNRTLADLLHHVRDDALVKWGWSPGGNRTTPPLAHDAFVSKMQQWIDLGAPCPDETAQLTEVKK